MKYLYDYEIMEWNERLEKSNFTIQTKTDLNTGEPNIIIHEKIDTNYHHSSPNNLSGSLGIQEPSIKFTMSFSIVSNRVDFFFDIFNKISSEEVGTKFVFYRNNNECSHKIEFQRNNITEKKISEHNISDKKYTNFKYEFDGNLSSIILYVQFLEDTINFFNKIWGYTESGDEICLLKYPIGSVVSPIKDKSKDYLIIEYNYIKSYKHYDIYYIASEILTKGHIIKYGETLSLKEDKLGFSRNNRIDNILN